MDKDQTNTTCSNCNCSNCKCSNCKHYKCMFTTVLIILLITGGFYFFTRHNNNQSEVIKAQESYINELRANLMHNNPTYDFDRYFNKLLDNTWLSFKRPLADVEEIISKSWNKSPNNKEAQSYYNYISIDTSDNEYVITMALPGFSKEEITIELSHNILKVNAKSTTMNRGKNEQDNANNEKQQTNALEQSIRVTSDIDQDNISAKLNNGLLTITLPRIHDKTSKETKKILVN